MTSPVRALALAASLMLGALPGLAQRAARAEVRADRTNLRAQPSRDSEVLASLRRGEIVNVLGEETSPGDRELWSRVALPSSVPVWIHAAGADKAGVVKNEKIYFRAGPGKNYSVLGNLRRGASVTILREFDGWLQISPPPGAVAFVASRLLASPGTVTPTPAPAPAVAAPTPAVPAPAAAVRSSNAPPATARTALSPAPSATQPATPPRSAPPVPPAAPSTTAARPGVNPTSDTAAPPATPAPRNIPPAVTPPAAAAVQQPRNEATRPAAVPPPRTTAAVPAPAEPPPAADPAPDPAPASRPAFRGSPREIASRSAAAPREFPLLASDPDPGRPKPEDTQVTPRRVTREGTVRRTVSPHAPSNFELRDGFYGEGVLDYLYLEPQDDLKKFLGQRVRVEGEEYRDSRWRTPVLKVQSVELAP